MSDPIAANYLENFRKTFRYYKTLGDKAFAQLADGDFDRALDAESNSIAVIAKHLGGNMRSRWRDFLTSDGEKPDRDRDDEFVAGGAGREQVLAWWEEGWGHALRELDALRPEDLTRVVHIRGEAHTVVEALNRQLAHAAYHVGQIVYLAKQWGGAQFQSLSIPRGKSDAFNQKMGITR
ncbi:MAG TPA: DUF1572 family protein [Gemmatimonadaceae bacterium]|nr:DUF1572 family protein [Gemmatimonadaceae bacterium]